MRGVCIVISRRLALHFFFFSSSEYVLTFYALTRYGRRLMVDRCRRRTKTSVTMWCSLHCLVRSALFVALALCLLTSLLARSSIVIYIAKVNHMIRKQLGFDVPARHSVVLHRNNCGSDNVYCIESVSRTVRNRSDHVDHGFAGMVVSNMVASRHNANLVLLGQLSGKSDGSMKRQSDQLVTETEHSFSPDVNRTIFRSRELVIWSSDHHPAPAYAAKHLLQPLGVRFLQHDLSPYQYCSYFNTCRERNSLKVSSRQNSKPWY